MAKLSARGRTELARLKKSTSDGTYTVTRVYMSDGNVLEKHDGAGFKSGSWNLRPQVKAAGTPLEQWKQSHLANGWTEVSRA